ncbi:transglycosylase SLT domain-containing protein [Falsigemmobacter faecalis]|uniref:Lytic transglycosylase domain-containing protein n=1 Tax=Falsigemmobacter faecalis TaxID=2488730 RepID=A0A3P3DKM9_9RHOB|nr:transglycosylase SLT domain-containing protein [Falsigemmobacter faecalis]RRH74286.1 lytic transglycosylase domain-containing protein [Falsigemmobacter faecalis]
MIRLITLLILLPALTSAAPSLCDDAARIAAKESGVPLSVLLAITRVETGQRRGGVNEPWPWTLNEAGQGRWLTTRREAETHLVNALKGGVRNIDIGCFQINFHWHGHHFSSAAQMLDPLVNARYAAAFLSKLYAESRDWQVAAGRYHSHTPELARRYLARLNAELPEQTAGNLQRGPGTPLLRGGTALSVGSLLRVSPGARALLPGPRPRFFGG